MVDIAEIGLVPYLLHQVEFGKALLAVALEAAENDNANLTIDLCGGGFVSVYHAAEEGDPRAIAIRDVITNWTCRMFKAPPETALCTLCGEPRRPPDHDVAVIVAVYAAVPTPRAMCCSPICMECCRSLSEFDNLMHEVMERFRAFLPKLHLVHVSPIEGHA